MLQLSREYVANVPPERNEFASKPSFLKKDPWAARTLCSTFITELLKACLSKPEIWQSKIAPKMGKISPFAKDYFDAINSNDERGLFQPIRRIQDVEPGDLIAIKFSELLDGFTGHCAIVSAKPAKFVDRLYEVEVIDSTGSPHGALDPRALRGHLGIGTGKMILLVEKDGWIVGYKWSRSSEEHLYADGKRKIAIGRLRAL
jgi:hypothetical protein